ncbi:c-type cytochrome [Palleronia sediminis]|uniref:C-type cytochrome n=1 Tax=Palleronia sediminis TaxID=2547833 RepID=A0A4R6A6A9_9RHOB|nr:c-type cytochrome [Palleronia sediminis]TDL78237.1 c-type cytochrome [Palleronia sediminis]
MKFIATTGIFLLGAGQALAATEVTGDAAAGEAVFNQCSACHVVADDEGNTLAGRAGRTGPNLYGIQGRVAGTVEDFRYSDAMVEAGEAGLEWNEADFVAYVQDPTGFLREYLDDSRARGKMAYKVRSEDDAKNVYAYIVSLGPEMEEGDAADAAAEDSAS